MKEPQNISVKGFWLGTRVPNLVIIAFTQYLAAYTLITANSGLVELLLDFRFFLLCSSTVMIAAAGYLINDYFDVKIDYINKPEKVVVGKLLKRRVVLVSYLVLNALGILIGALLNVYILLIHINSAVFLWLYSLDLKKRPFVGNLIIGLLTGAAILIVGIYYRTISGELLLYSGFAFFFTLVREIVKDMEDLKGDRTFGCKTLPVIWGYRGTKKFIYLMSFLFLSGIILLAIQVRHTQLTWIVTGIVPITIMYNVRLYRSDTKKAFAHLSTLSKYIMILGITTMILFK